MTDRTFTRRETLASSTAVLPLLAGCVGDDGTDEPAGTNTETGMETPGDGPSATPSEMPTDTPEPTPTDTPEPTSTDTPTPNPSAIPHEKVIAAARGSIHDPDSTAENEMFSMAYLSSENDLEKLTYDRLGDDHHTFLEETNFERDVVIAAQTTVPTYAGGPVITDVTTDASTLWVQIWMDSQPGGLHADITHLTLVRVMPEADQPADAGVLLENPTWKEETAVYGTMDDNEQSPPT